MDVARVVLPAPPGPSMATIMGPSAGLAEAFRRTISTDDALGQRDLVLHGSHSEHHRGWQECARAARAQGLLAEGVPPGAGELRDAQCPLEIRRLGHGDGSLVCGASPQQ